MTAAVPATEAAASADAAAAPAARPVAQPATGRRPAHASAASAAPQGRPAGGTRAGLVGWVLVVGVALVWGTWTVADAGVALRAAPLAARWRWTGGIGLVPAAAVGTLVVWRGPDLARRLDIRRVPIATGVAAGVWTVALAASDGWHRITAPLTTRHDYEPFAAGVVGLGELLRTYDGNLVTAPVHVQGHPPGPVVLAWALDRVGLGGAGWLAGMVVVAWGVAAAAAVVAARAIAGDAAARRAAPALAVLPAAVWAGTSLDAVFAALAGVTVALAAVAGRRARTGGVALAAAAGVVGGAALLSTYGAVLAVAVAGTVLVVLAPSGGGPRVLVRPARSHWRQWPTAAVRHCLQFRVASAGPRVRLLAAAGIGTGAVLAVAAGAGFWWPDGLAATSARYWDGIGSDRPALYTTVAGNPAALALATGPAVAAGLATVLRHPARHRPTALAARPAVAGLATPRHRRAALLPGLALAAVALADLSQMARGEVERIWLPFVPWLALAAPGDRRTWLGAQVALALVLESVLASPW